MSNELGAVVDLGSACGGERNGARRHAEAALELGVDAAEVGGNVLAGGVEDLEGLDLDVAPSRIGLEALGGCLVGIAAGQAHDGHGAASEGSAVVDLGRACGNDIDRRGVGRNLELAKILGRDGVVGRLRAVVPLDFVGVVALAYHGLRAGGHKGRRLVANEAGHLAAGGQGGAVVALLGREGLDRKLGRLDLDGAVDLGDLEVIGDVDALGVEDYQVVGRGGDAFAVGVGGRSV